MSSTLDTIPVDVGSRTPAEVYDRTSDKTPEAEKPFLERLLGLRERLNNEDTAKDREVYAKAVTNEMMYRGQQHGFLNKYNNRWEQYPQAVGRAKKAYNLFRGHCDAITVQHTLARVDLQIVPLPADDADDETIAKAKFANELVDYYEETLLDETSKQIEGKRKEFGGGVFRRLRWNPKDAKQTYKKPVFENQPIKLAPDAFTCATCERDGLADELVDDTCPYCSSPDVAKIEVPQEEIPMVSGYEDVPCGDFICDSYPIYAVKFDRAGGTFNKATWMSLKFRARPEEIKAKIPWWRRQADNEAGQSDGIRAESVLARATGSSPMNVGTTGKSSDAERVTVEMLWLMPLWYSDWRMPENLPLGSGDVIPQGAEVKQIYPKGMYILFVNNEPLDFANEDFHSEWRFTPHILIPSTPEGDGIEDLIPFQQDINVTKNLQISNIRYVDGAGLIYRPQYLENQQLSGLPYERHAVKNNWPEEYPLRNVVDVLPRAPLPSEVPMYGEESRRDMQWASKANSTSIGSPDINSMGGQKTLGGMQLMTQQASSQRAPELAVQAQTDCEWAELLLTQFAENAIYERYLPLQGKVGLPNGIRLTGKDVAAKFRVTAKRRSYLPKTEDDRRMDLMGAFQALQAAGGIEAAVQFPGLRRQIEERFNVDLELDSSNLDAHECRKRLEKMKQMVGQAMQASMAIGPEAAPTLLSQMVPIMPDADEHSVCIKWYQDWLKQDEADRVHPIVKEAAHAKIAEHKAAIVQIEQEKTSMQVTAQAPAMEAGQEQQQQAAMQQQQMQAEQMAQAQEMEAQKQQVMQDAQAEQQVGQHLLQEQAKENEHQRQLEMEAVKQEGAKELAKLKPQPKATK